MTLTQTWRAAAQDVHAQATTGGAASPRLDDSWAQLCRVSRRMTGFVAAALLRVLDFCAGISCRLDTGGGSHRQIMAKHMSPSYRRFSDFWRAWTVGGGGG